MAKGQQRGNREAKKPKKDKSAPKPTTPASLVSQPANTVDHKKR